jgi:hypothetical protein
MDARPLQQLVEALEGRMKITKTGTVRIEPDGTVFIGEDFEFDETEDSHIAGCRSVALLGAMWALERLGEHVRKTIEKPGGGMIVVE